MKEQGHVEDAGTSGAWFVSRVHWLRDGYVTPRPTVRQVYWQTPQPCSVAEWRGCVSCWWDIVVLSVIPCCKAPGPGLCVLTERMCHPCFTSHCVDTVCAWTQSSPRAVLARHTEWVQSCQSDHGSDKRVLFSGRWMLSQVREVRRFEERADGCY